MHALAALILLTACAGADAARYSSKYSAAATLPPPPPTDPVDALTAQALQSLDGRERARWLQRAVLCARQLGPSRCLKAFAVCRGERAAASLDRGEGLHFSLREDLDQFQWERFSNTSDDQLDAQLMEQTGKVFDGRSLTLRYTGGVMMNVDSQRNGSLRVDVKRDLSVKDEVSLGRGRGTRWRKRFYRIVPYLLIPPLIMAAILPFKLPAFMMLSMGAVLINNMALTGSLFTLLRNNAFDDNYEKKVVYVNDGYKNEASMSAIPDGGAFAEGMFPDGTLISDQHFIQGGYQEPQEPFPPEGFHAETVQEDAFFQNDKGKKRRGNKHKRKPGKRKPGNEDGGSLWGSPGNIYELEKLAESEVNSQQFHALDGSDSNVHNIKFGDVIVGEDQTPEILDYSTNYNRKSFKPSLPA